MRGSSTDCGVERWTPRNNWSCYEYVGLPKASAAFLARWSDFQWIGKAPRMQKAYLRMSAAEASRQRRRPAQERVQTLGSRPGKSVGDINGLLSEALSFGSSCGVPVAIAAMDALTAFELLARELIERAMTFVGFLEWCFFSTL